jgi:hypothetical protein
MKLKLLNFIALCLLSCGDNTSTTTASTIRSEETQSHISSSEWFALNHHDKIAHVDKSRNITQIKVLNQITLGSRQCGYHGVRNFFYLAALAQAIEKRDSALINKLYKELHDKEKFKIFVDALAKLKGCPTGFFHESFPDEAELKELFKVNADIFPSSFNLSDILRYRVGDNSTPRFTFFKYPTKENLESSKPVTDIHNLEREFEVTIPLNDSLKELMRLDMPADLGAALLIAERLARNEVMALDISLLGSPGHAVAASFFQSKSDTKPQILFADSWGDASFLTGWSKATMDVLYELITHYEDNLNRFLLVRFNAAFHKLALLSDAASSKSLKETLARVERSKRPELLKRLENSKKLFFNLTKILGLEKASLYNLLLKIINKIDNLYDEAFKN